MQMFYSAATGGFYCEEIHGEQMPADVVQISHELYQATRGKHIVPDANGMPSVFVPPEADPRHALKAAATQKRWEVETGGIELPNGLRVATTKADQDRITSVIANAAHAGVESVDFKADSGWVTLSLAEVHTVAAAVALHVQACFSAERAHHDAIDASPLPELGVYDLEQGWP